MWWSIWITLPAWHVESAGEHRRRFPDTLGADWTGKALIPRFAVRIHEDLREPNFDVVVTFLVVPVATRLFVGGKIEETFKAFDRRYLADLPEWSGIEECCWSSADGWLLFSPTRIVRAHCDVSLHEWVNLPHLSDVRVHAALETYVCMYESISNPFEYPAPARFPRALLGRCPWISGVLLLPSFLVDLCDWWPTALNAMLGQLWKYSCGLHYTSPANSNDLKDRRNSLSHQWNYWASDRFPSIKRTEVFAHCSGDAPWAERNFRAARLIFWG